MTRTHTVGLLWTRDRSVAETSTVQHTTLSSHIHTPGVIRTRNPNKRTNSDAHLRPRRHHDRKNYIFFFFPIHKFQDLRNLNEVISKCAHRQISFCQPETRYSQREKETGTLSICAASRIMCMQIFCWELFFVRWRIIEINDIWRVDSAHVSCLLVVTTLRGLSSFLCFDISSSSWDTTTAANKHQTGTPRRSNNHPPGLNEVYFPGFFFFFFETLISLRQNILAPPISIFSFSQII